ncbi:protein borderless isoform X4 [Contarinia nasturtii]|nr:protein borderless isoform X4 [Contarinia nasturtii]XP_031624014.1 protein borderless isoform X4 [Contarinia nasturtii]XP_031624015.1 protein borderless isoform X4 [Contarinia nasturtii]XP_031624016.1 protein borderless isoform X4 [Contarinia nasturtii]XP_031624017.1 protein borderless isoform X4 [Contarinia nasturtii]XP_031624018.1 protein borderless isoform X4 [Contarinia nasturtii]
MELRMRTIAVAALTLHLLCMCQCIDIDLLNKQATYVDAKVGEYAVFNCPLDFPQDIEIPYILHWNKEGHKAFAWYDGKLSAADYYVGRVALLDNAYGYGRASVNLTSIRETDSGWYECRVIFPNRTPSTRNNGTWFHLAVESGSLIKIPPINQTVMEGEMAFFHCVTKEPELSFATWYKDGIAISDLDDLGQRSVITSDGSLTINPTVMTDLGEYVCIVKSIENDEQQAKAYLNVQYKAKVIYAPAEMYLPFGRPATLDCHFRSNPPLTNLRWEKDGFLYDPYNVQGVFYRRNGSIFFNSVDESHAGRYSCTPYNDLGTEGPSTLIRVFVQRPPIFTLKPKPIYVHKLGDTATFQCDATDQDGQHRPIIQWRRKDGIPLPFSRTTIEGINFVIENINETDRGIYECVAENEAARITVDSELLIENVAPHPPYNLTANSTDTSITLRWEPGYIRPYLEYVVWYRLADATEWRTLRMLTHPPVRSYENFNNQNMHATVTNLEPGREYEFMVLSQDRFGDGMFSKTFRYFTKASEYFTDAPDQLNEPVMHFAQIGPPRNLTVHQTDAGDEFVASWYAPEYGNETLRVYVLRWFREPGHFLTGTAETRETYYKVRYLMENELYSFQVFSLSTTDYQAGSNEFDIRIPPYRIRMRVIAICITLIILFMLVFAAIFIYAKKRCFEPYPDNDEKLQKP